MGAATHADDDYPEWPQAWFEPAKTASELGITTFSQSPLLDGRNLPPVAERLPDDPVVVVPLDPNGVYGGVARITTNEWLTFPNVESPLTISADMRTFLPNLAESWSVSPDGRIITLKLRAGIKWSDGMPLTSDDFLFSFNDLWLNDEYSPVPDPANVGARAVALDALTFQYQFPDPYPLFVNRLAQYGNFMVLPKHYYRDFHPGYVDREVLNARIKATGFITWMAFIDACRRGLIEKSAEAPTLDAHHMVSRTLSRIRFERNPYYFKIDPKGRQLPYIDGIISEEVANKEVITSMASTGQLDFSAYELRTQDIPLLKLGERTNNIRVHIWNRLHSSDVVIQPNYNYRDERLRQLYWDKRFRHALSIAINRDEMNQLIYFGRGTPRQVTVHPSSRYFEAHYATDYTDYDPDRARLLLDEIGLHDIDGDGLREYADGSKLTITVEYIDWETPKAINMELVTSYWQAVGIDLRQKLVDSSLQAARAQSGEMQMTLWHADRVTDILFPLSPDWWVPRRAGWDNAMWNDWSRWYQTKGRLGTEPPPIMQQLQVWSDEMRTTMDEDLRLAMGKNILATNAENVWTFGTVGLAPHPVVVSKHLRGVPPNGIWGWDNRWTLSYHPSTWYFENGDSMH
jgi:peptide/nickel transport system substrate-binding protein